MLISHFPEEFNITKWITKHKYTFLVLNVLIDVLLSSISLFKPYSTNTIMVENEKRYETCKYNEEYGIIILIVCKMLIIFSLLFLIFVEWNFSNILYDLRLIVLTQYISILSIILILITYFIQFKYYKTYFLIQTINIFIISVANYIILYGIRLCLAFLKKQNVKLQFINSINEKFINNESHMNSKSCYGKTTIDGNKSNIFKSNAMEEDEIHDNNDTTNTSSIRKKSFMLRMINYHYTSESNSYLSTIEKTDSKI